MYGILYNPISGRGLGENYAKQIVEYFLQKGERILLRESKSDGIDSDFLKNLIGLIFVGGDGTLRPYLPSLAEMQIPVILFPAGNESLIAKQFRVDRDIPKLYERVKSDKPTMHYYGLVNQEPFFLMCSVGFDAEVVHWVKQNRKSYSSDFLYLKGILASLFKSLNTYKLEYGDQVVSLSGTLIVANSRCYGGNISPVPDADSRDDKLNIRCFKGSYLSVLLKFIFMRMGIDRFRGSKEVKSVKIVGMHEKSLRYQIDGEARAVASSLTVEVSERRVGFY